MGISLHLFCKIWFQCAFELIDANACQQFCIGKTHHDKNGKQNFWISLPIQRIPFLRQFQYTLHDPAKKNYWKLCDSLQIVDNIYGNFNEMIKVVK